MKRTIIIASTCIFIVLGISLLWVFNSASFPVSGVTVPPAPKFPSISENISLPTPTINPTHPDGLDTGEVERIGFDESLPIQTNIFYGDKFGNQRVYPTNNKDYFYLRDKISEDIERLKSCTLIKEDFNLLKIGMGRQFTEEIIGKPAESEKWLATYVLEDGTEVELQYVKGEFTSKITGFSSTTEVLTSAFYIDEQGVRNGIMLEEYNTSE